MTTAILDEAFLLPLDITQDNENVYALPSSSTFVASINDNAILLSRLIGILLSAADDPVREDIVNIVLLPVNRPDQLAEQLLSEVCTDPERVNLLRTFQFCTDATDVEIVTRGELLAMIFTEIVAVAFLCRSRLCIIMLIRAVLSTN